MNQVNGSHRWLFASLPLMCAVSTHVTAQEENCWSGAKTEEILAKTVSVDVAPDLTGLSTAEQQAVGHLLAAGHILHDLYLRQRHEAAREAKTQLDQSASADRTSLLQLFHLFKGPIATTLDNQRVAFLPVSAEVPGRNVYPTDADKEEIDAACAADPALRDQLLGLRSIVRRSNRDNFARDLQTLKQYPVLAALHHDFQQFAQHAHPDTNPADRPFYAVPYAIAYAPAIMKVYGLLGEAAAALQHEDPEFSGYLRHRARDLLTANYEAGDASWVTGNFKNLNAQIGSYETYDDAMYGVKAFYSLSLLARDQQRSEQLATGMQDIQKIEDALPYSAHKRVRTNIPVGVYNVIADFGQARGTNTATILPNEAEHARKYGRTILLRYNIMTHPELFKIAQQRFHSAVAPAFRDDLTLEGGFQRTLWHEVGHYLGVDRTEDGRELSAALQRYSDTFEEMKADLVSLFSAKMLHESGFHTDSELRSIYAGGILRVLQTNEPRREQPYQTMQLMQWNYFLEHGLLEFDDQRAVMSINYDRYHDVIKSLLEQVLNIQRQGNLKQAEEFVEKYTAWSDDLHERVAARLRDSVQYRYRYVNYTALPDQPRF